MMLGQIIRDLGTGQIMVALLNHADQSDLVARLDGAACRNGEGIGDYAAASLERFINRANDEAWLALMGSIERAAGTTADPGGICLRVCWIGLCVRKSIGINTNNRRACKTIALILSTV
jgi:hypothetical protein